jgi:uncharacterized protein involved in response to NO
LIWEPFFWAAVTLALVAGFGLGGALFALQALGQPVGPWWAAAARVHGHVQLVGWAGLMVLGVGLHFLPRLRGRPLAHPEHARTVVVLVGAGLLLRLITEPMLAATSGARLVILLRAGLVASGLLELVGVTLAIGLLVLSIRGDPPARSRPGFQQVVPLLATAFAGLWLATLANLGVVLEIAAANNRAASAFDALATLFALYLFLIPISVGMGARVFPLHFAAQQADDRLLRVGLGLLLLGIFLRVAGESTAQPLVGGAGLALLAAALCLFLIGVRVFAARRAVAGKRRTWYADAAQWHGLTAAAWLGLDALLLALTAAAALTQGAANIALDAERHIIGAGFVTLLILGEGANLLPGFARRPLRSDALVWATLGLGNAAALLRVGPELLGGLIRGPLVEAALATAGLVGMLAIGAFAINLTRSGRQRVAARIRVDD